MRENVKRRAFPINLQTEQTLSLFPLSKQSSDSDQRGDGVRCSCPGTISTLGLVCQTDISRAIPIAAHAHHVSWQNSLIKSGARQSNL